MSGDDASTPSRRAILSATGAAVGLPGVVRARDGDDDRRRPWVRCPDATTEPSMGSCAGASTAACADDHPETRALQEDVRWTLESRYPTVGSLIDDGFVPYFDLAKSPDEGGWSHWLSPEYIADETVLDPSRPEAVLVDNEWWRPIGVMFVATRNGERIDRPPAAYRIEENGDDELDDGNPSSVPEAGDRCSPWHYHAGLPGRFAWWYYRQVYEGDYRTGDVVLPCRTPCMLHVWIYPHPEGVYAHDAPPKENRGGPPAEPTGLENGTDSESHDLGWETLPDRVVPSRKPADFRWLSGGR